MQEKRLLNKLNFIEIYQIFGGIIGLLIMLYLVITVNSSFSLSNISSFLLILFPILFFGLCIYSGILINKKKYKSGLNLVIIQLIGFHINSFFYSVVNGIGINLTLDLTNDFITGFGFEPSQFLITADSAKEILLFKLNLGAIFMLVYSNNVLNTIKSR